jgi:hypothetical protein
LFDRANRKTFTGARQVTELQSYSGIFEFRFLTFDWGRPARIRRFEDDRFADETAEYSQGMEFFYRS